MEKGCVLISTERYEALLECETRLNVLAEIVGNSSYFSLEEALSILRLTDALDKMKKKREEDTRRINEKIKNGELLNV